MIRDTFGNTHPTVLAAVVSALRASRFYTTTATLALRDLRSLQENLDTIIASAACATITPELDGAVTPPRSTRAPSRS
jgi:L-rhamnose isomerase